MKKLIALSLAVGIAVIALAMSATASTTQTTLTGGYLIQPQQSVAPPSGS